MEQERHACASPAFADDLALLTGNTSDMRIQADKVTAYMQWSGMAVNHAKSGTTGMVYGAAGSGLLSGGPLSNEGVSYLRTQLSFTISGRAVPFLHPHGEPYKYLGVWLTPSINWRHQQAALTEAAIDKADSILRSPASASQKLRLLETLLRPFIRYSFSTGAYTAADITRLDSIMSCAAKFAWGLPRCTPTALVQEDQDRGGMGVTSLQEEYVKEMVATLTDALNDTGRLGAVTNALLRQQVHAVGCAADGALADRLRHSRLLRALTWLQAAGGQMTRHTGEGQAEWMQLAGCDLTTLMLGLRNDPMELGLPGKVPLHQFRPLLETGVTSLTQLLEAGTGRMVPASKLTAHLQLHGLTARSTPALRRAYNRLTLLLSADPAEGPPRVGAVADGDLPAEQRELRHGQAGTAAPADGRYANGQAMITEFLRPLSGDELATGAHLQADPAEGPSPRADRPRRRRRAQVGTVGQMREMTEGYLEEYVQRLHARWNKPLRDAHVGCQPPWPRGQGDVELTEELQRWLCTSCKDATLVNYLYAEWDVPTYVEAAIQTAEWKGKGLRRQCTGRQLKYKVRWEPTVVAEAHLALYDKLGYRPATVEPCPVDATPWWAQEYNVSMVRVTWQPSLEPAEGFLSAHEELGARLIEEFQQRQAAANVEYEAARAARVARSLLPTREQQGVVQPPQPAWELADPWAMSRIELDVAACHPELDVQPPPGTTGFFLREPGADEGSRREPVLHMHHPDGRWLGTITRDRVTHLRARFEQTQASRPDLMCELGARCFTDELALLMLRRASDTKAPHMSADTLQETYGVAQDNVVQAIQAATGADVELFASPLDVHASMASYMSSHERDQLFGAGHDAYSRRWAGACYAYPPEGEAEQAVRWALASAREAPADCPVLVVLHLPCEPNAPHQRWLEYPEAVRLAAYRGSLHPRILSACNWQGGSDNRWAVASKVGSHPGYQLVAIGNETGKRLLLAAGPALRDAFASMPSWLARDGGGELWPARGGVYSLETFEAAVATHLQGCQAVTQQLTQGYRPPRKLLGTEATTRHLPRTLPTTNEQAGWQPLPVHKHAECPPRHDWQDAYFTDGSVSAAGVGAAVFRATRGMWRIKPNGEGPTNTITRAELAAIYHTLHNIAPDEPDCTIFTDSQASIHLLGRALHRRYTLERHPHRQLLVETAEHLVRRANAGLRTRILKVPAHTGIRGNEAADQAAKEAARPEQDCAYTTDAHLPFAGQWWPAFWTKPSSDADGEPTLRVAANLKGALRRHLHATLRTGGSPVGVYAASWRALYDHPEGASPKESSAKWKRGRVSEAAIRSNLKFAWGQFWNKKLAKRYARPYRRGEPAATDDRCPLCGLPDSCGHIQGGCQPRQMQAMYTAKHNKAVQKIARALQRRSRDGGCYMVMDACRTDELAGHEAATSKVPCFLLPNTPEADRRRMRPDILRVSNLPAVPSPGQITEACAHKHRHPLQLVEVGFTSDTRWQDKMQEKRGQHEALVAALRAAGWTVNAHVVLVGHCGTVYKTGLTALQDMGVSKQNASALLEDLSIHAVVAAHEIGMARRRLERISGRVGVG